MQPKWVIPLLSDLKSRVIIGWVFIGLLGGLAIAADVVSVVKWSGAPTKAYVKHTASKAVSTEIGGQNVVALCEASIASAIQAAGAVATGFKDPHVGALQKDGSVRVTVTVEGTKVAGPAHCVLTKGIYQAREVGPGV